MHVACVCVCVCAQLSVFVSLYPRPLDFSCAICSSPLKPDSVFQLLFYSSQNSWSFVFKECFMFYLLLLFFFLFCLTHRLKPLCYKYEVGIAVCLYHPHQQHFIPVGIMIIMEICKAPPLRLKALNKHSITHIMYIKMENVISNKNKM